MPIEFQDLPDTPDLSPQARTAAEVDLRMLTQALLRKHLNGDFSSYIKGLLDSITPQLQKVIRDFNRGSIGDARLTLSEMIEEIHPEVFDIPEEIQGHANIQAMSLDILKDKIGPKDMLVLLALFQLVEILGERAYSSLVGEESLARFRSFTLMAQLLPTTHPLPFRSDEGIEYTVQLTPNEGVYINPKKIDLTSFSAKNPSVIEVVADETGMTRERLKNVLALMRRES